MIARTRDERTMISLTVGCVLAVCAAFCVLESEGCKPGVTPASIVQQVEGVVAKDLAAGDSLTQVQADVAAAISQDVSSPLVAEMLDDALQALIDAEVLAPAVMAKAKAMEAVVHPRVLALRLDAGP